MAWTLDLWRTQTTPLFQHQLWLWKSRSQPHFVSYTTNLNFTGDNSNPTLGFYCKQKGHCGKGMVFSINPSTDKTQADFKQLAIKQNGTALSTAVIVGGPAAATTVSVAAPAATTAAGAGTMVAGSGTVVVGGACSCSCLCGVESFPNAAQGLGAFGGLSG
jgi:hypothetical protein